MNDQENIDTLIKMLDTREHLHDLFTFGFLLFIIISVLLKNERVWHGKLKILTNNIGIISIITAAIVTLIAHYYIYIDPNKSSGGDFAFCLFIFTLISLGSITAESKNQKIIMGPVAIATFFFILVLVTAFG